MGNQGIEWQVLNPSAGREEVTETPAPRLQTLSDKRVGLFWNGKPGGDVLLDSVTKLLQGKFEDMQFQEFPLFINAGEENIRKMAGCDAVVAVIGDCGSCTTHLVRDSIGIEKLSTPTVVLVTEPFANLARLVAKAAGLESLPRVIIPHPQAGLPKDIVHERISKIINDITSALLQSPQGGRVTAGKKVITEAGSELIVISGRSNSDALKKVNRHFYENKWTDGFPIVPPTEEAVQWMLTGTDRDSNEIVALIPPAYGRATIRNIAINSVMAGAEPEYMPVIIAAVEAITDPLFAVGEQRWGALGMQTTTGPVTPLLIVNGPVAKDLNIESGYGCFSRGHKANATIGRALRLILINAGGAYPGINDMKGQGSAQEFTFCVAEQEEHRVYRQGPRPWQPLHVERGFPRESSTVTAVAAWPPLNVDDFNDCSPKILNRVVAAISNLAAVPLTLDRDCVLILGPTHAECLADAGMSKDDIREYIYANAVMPWRWYKEQYPGPFQLQPRWMRYINDEMTTVHLFESPKNFHVIVAGGPCSYSQVVRASYKIVTKEIRLSKK
jgi:hypothetical protein